MAKLKVEDILERLALTLVLWDQGSPQSFTANLSNLVSLLEDAPEILLQTLEILKQLAMETTEPNGAGKLARLEEGFSLIREHLAGKERLQAMDEFIHKADNGEGLACFAMEAEEIGQLPDFYADFVAETEPWLESIESELNNLTDSGDFNRIPRLARAFHRLNSMAGMGGFDVLAGVAGAAEEALSRLEKEEDVPEQGMIDCLVVIVKLYKDVLQKIPETADKTELDLAYKKKGQEIIERLDKGLFELPVKRAKIGEILLEKGAASEAQIQQALEQQEKAPEKRLGEILVQNNILTTEQINRTLQEQKTTVSHRENDMISTIRIDTEKLDLLLDTVGEIVITHSLVASDPQVLGLHDENTLGKIALLTRNILALQRVATNLRMVPIQQVFQKLGRISRDIAQKSGKEIHILFEGEKTEIDRNIAELIYDPLVHMVRNAADHGIESPETRRAMNKPEHGTIKVSADCRQGKVILQIADDGKGLDKDKILAKAIEQGHAKPDQGLSDAQVYQLIFMPGLSTATKVTEISGRGVGMDVVKSNIDRLQGKIKVDTMVGEGTTFTIRLPLTLAIVDGMVVRVGEQRYVLPLTAVREVFQPQADQVFTIQGREERVKLRENLYRLIRLYRKFQIPGAVEIPSEGMLIVVEDEAGKAALMVDELLGKQQVVVKNLGEGFKKLQGVSGAAILGQGNPGLILDIGGVIHDELVV